MADLDATLSSAFLDHLEAERANSVATRNLRLTAIHSLFAYAALRCPEHAASIQRVLAIPSKRTETTIVEHLTRAETEALLAAPDRSTRLGRRDHALLLVAVQTGLRVSELGALSCRDVTFGRGAHVFTQDKGRKERCTPLLPATARLIQDWVHEQGTSPSEPLFPGRLGDRLSSDAIQDIVDKHAADAAGRCPSLGSKQVTPHTLRHTCAMDLLHAGTDVATIALWLTRSSSR